VHCKKKKGRGRKLRRMWRAMGRKLKINILLFEAMFMLILFMKSWP
jgi:hypothetical protein